MNKKINLIGVGGFARAGKDMFVKIASKILKKNGYDTKKFAFADELKKDLDEWLLEKYGISAWTTDEKEKALIRPILVAHGCAKRNQTDGKYWVDKVNDSILDYVDVLTIDLKKDTSKLVMFVSDVRFVNEAEWVHSLGGQVIHLKKFEMSQFSQTSNYKPYRVYYGAPNEEERINDPLLQAKADVFLELENIATKTTNIITEETLLNDSYLNEEIMLCLSKFPFLNIQTK